MNSKALDWTVLTLVIIGSINWGLIGFFQFDLVSTLFGGISSWLSRIIFAVVGLAGLYALTMYTRLGRDMVSGK